jgi:ribA/ribD-fused uncharacterized protein
MTPSINNAGECAMSANSNAATKPKPFNPGPYTMSPDGTLLLFYGSIYSNWAEAKFYDSVSRQWFESSEHYFMWSKAQEFGDVVAMAHIMKVGRHPATCKAIGKQIKGYDERRWDAVRYEIMVHACMMKFTQNKEMGEALMATNGATLVEASPVDKVWGIGLGEHDKRAMFPAQWQGQNLLGKALMEVRTRLRKMNEMGVK